MFILTKITVPELYANCASCGCHGNDMRTLQAFQTITINGHEYQITSHVTMLYLCKDCREELRKLLGDAPEEGNDAKRSQQEK